MFPNERIASGSDTTNGRYQTLFQKKLSSRVRKTALRPLATTTIAGKVLYPRATDAVGICSELHLPGY
ncbi:hypothetical protein AXG93_531s1090 [Marchantia polymorpha subsp. ruderalis]|uniref:Uncharacterized protein n=1 Tax=Marchantia polymorpha subsp. ruderalis TaxID=1480154 RepID=A0A176VPR2_MARPO|nr:hypothetical protein AXG93_531s1090 [Marchantia polymorpha subsp. ruderalis]